MIMYTRYLAGLFFVCLLFPYSLIYSGQQSGGNTDTIKFFRINPLNSLSAGYVYLSTTYPVERYTFPNQDATFADEGSNFYLIGTGDGTISSFIDFNYDLRINTIEGVRFKKGSVFLRSQAVSLEIGRNNIWLGSGYYGSLILSNNAEPYTLVRFRTEKPFRIPYIGQFDYSLFHGWPRNFKIIGHNLIWYPASWLEINLKQTTVYSEKYTIGEYFRLFTAREANLAEGLGKTDSRASIGISTKLDFFTKISPVISGVRVYFEFGGEDIYAIWQKPDVVFDKNLWLGPFGFQFLDTALLTGLFVEVFNTEFRIEYAQNYKNQYVFYDPYKGRRPYNMSWYTGSSQPQFLNNNAFLGHHMGSSAELLSLHLSRTFSIIKADLMFSRRHRWNVRLGPDYIDSFKVGIAERQDSFTGTLEYPLHNYRVYFYFTFNAYKNVDMNVTPAYNEPVPGITAREFLTGVILRVYF